MFNHMSTVINSTIYTIGGTAIYWTPKLTPSSVVSANNNSAYILKTANSFLRALDLSKPLDFEAEFSDTTEVISKLPLTIPLLKRGALWADQNTIYYWGGELEMESIYLDETFQNKTREWPDPMKYYTYDLSQPRGFGAWKTVSIPGAGRSDRLTSSPSYGESTYAADARKGFYLGGAMARHQLKNKDGSNATRNGSIYYDVSSMVIFDAATSVWKNETIIAELNGLRDGTMVYFAGVGEKGILVRMGGAREDQFVGFALILRHIFSLKFFATVYIYDIAAGVWYRQPTTSKTNIFPETRWGGFCAGAVAAPDKTSFTVYIYGGFDNDGHVKRTWALTMPYFHWFPMGSSGEPEGGRSDTRCHTVGGQLVMVRGKGDRQNRGDTNGGSYFYDMTNLTWSLKYQPSEYRVPKTIYDVIGGNGQGGATLTGPADDKGFARGLGKLFAAAAGSSNSPNPSGGNSTSTGGGSSTSTGGASSTSTGGGSSRSTGTIVGGVIGSVAFVAIVVGIGTLLLRRRGGADPPMGQGAGAAPGAGGNPPAPDQGGFAQWT
ncbi:hypothetical protein HOY80DRAFT_1140807 [Tuber brumale]|nr:hypothetical protein HOY80DRAFT_1140807 [Tuber brumale]